MYGVCLFMRIIGKIIYDVSICLNWIPTPKNDNTHRTAPVSFKIQNSHTPRSGFGYPNFFKRLRYLFYHGECEIWEI